MGYFNNLFRTADDYERNGFDTSMEKIILDMEMHDLKDANESLLLENKKLKKQNKKLKKKLKKIDNTKEKKYERRQHGGR